MAKTKANVVSMKPRNLAHVKRDRGYRWANRDPQLDALCRIITDSNLPAYIISQKVAATFGNPVSATTIYNWLDGHTKKPQNFTMDRVAHVLGYERSTWKRQKN